MTSGAAEPTHPPRPAAHRDAPAARFASGDWSGQRCLVTGAASGLGEALTAVLRAGGAQVLATDLAAPHGPDSAALDVRSEEAWDAAVSIAQERWGGLDLLVNNAGVAGGGRLDLCTVEEWEWIADINLLGVVRGTRAVIGLMRSQGSGRILNVASLAGLVHPAGMGSYNAVKAAVVALTETTGHELASSGVTAHVACPSYFRTNLTASLRTSDPAVQGIMGRLIENATWEARQMATAILSELAMGEEVIVPDPAARAAYDLKRDDPVAYRSMMRAQALKLEVRR